MASLTDESRRDTTLSAFEPVLSRIVDGVSGRDLTAKSAEGVELFLVR